jgi:hypothetical protein
VSAGVFSVQLDFGANAFPSANRWLQIAARVTGAQTFTMLAPRQQITSTPYAIRSLNASSADTVIVNGVPPGSANYIQNNSTPQADSKFNISGNGTAAGTLSGGVVDAATQYNLGGERMLTSFNRNLFVGENAGLSHPSNGGTFNTFVGTNAGAFNTLGESNTFFGSEAGNINAEGSRNSMFGTAAGDSNTLGDDNSFFGYIAGVSNTVGVRNTFLGSNAGWLNTIGSRNTAIGSHANIGINSTLHFTNATAIGADARVEQSNSMVLGSIAGVNGATSSVNVGIGTTVPILPLHVKGDVLVQTTGSGGNIQFGTPNAETGISIAKTGFNRADLRFDGSVLKLVAATSTIPPAATNGLAITTNGDVGIGTTTPNQKLSVNGGASKIGGGSWDTFSDERLKTIKGTFTGGLAAIMQLHPLRYEYKKGNALRIDSSKEYIGFSAQAVQQSIPEAVSRNDNGYLLINNDPIIWTMLNAIKEQQLQIEELRSEVRRLRNDSVPRVSRKMKRPGPSRR